jgi:ankyrin repeat protein
MNLFYSKKKFLDAVVRGDIKTVETYLAASKSWASCQDDKTKEYPLHYAVRSGHRDILRRLLAAGANISAAGNNSQTPLHTAVTVGFADIVEILLNAGAERYINYADPNGLSPLDTAIQRGKTEILKVMLDTKKADLNTAQRPALYYAAECGQLACVKILLAAGADPNVPRSETRYEYDDDDDDDYYYSRHREPSKTIITQSSPLICACINNQADIARELLKAGARALPGECPLHFAADWGNIPLMTLLIENGFDPKSVNSGRETLLHRALKSQHRENRAGMVLFLLAQGVSKEALDNDKRTALSYAQQFALTDVVKILQDPLPAQVLTPVKLLNVPVLPTPVPAPPPPASSPESAPPQDTETWSLAGAKSVVHATLYPGLGRRLTEIFNFEARERITITENFTLKTETMGPHENFDNIGDEALRKAFDEFRRLGGKAEEGAVFGNRLMKMKMKPG